MNDALTAKKKLADPTGITRQRVSLAMMGTNKPDKWEKMLQEKEVHDSVDKFVNTKEIKLLLVTWDTAGNLVAYNAMPRNMNINGMKKKSMAFFKTECVGLTPKNYNRVIFTIEYTNTPLENLSNLSRGVFLPLIKNELNRDQWSRAASQRILFEFNAFISELYVVVGESQGKTLLPLPPQQIFDTAVDELHRLGILEQSLTQWTKQIKHAIAKDPMLLFKNGGTPDPLDELRFWTEKADDLKQIEEQLRSDELQQLIEYVRQSDSIERNQVLLLDEFDKLNQELRRKLYEASSNVCFLKSLHKEFDTLRDCMEFLMLQEVYAPLMQKLLLIFKHSDCYNTVDRLQVLIQQINNSIIAQASKYVNGEEIFRCLDDDNADEAVQKIQETIDCCQRFKSIFLECKSVALNTLKLPIADNDAWCKSSIDKMFFRFDIFIERCRDAMSFSKRVQQFSKLEKIYIGGTSGKELTEQIREIYERFHKLIKVFKDSSYDMMDITAQQFDADFYEFRRNTKELEKRLATILCKGFDDLTTMHSRFQLLDGFEGLLNRPILRDEFQNKQFLLIENFASELRGLQQQFEGNKTSPPIHSNLPQYSGAVAWCRGFKQRILPSMNKLKQIIGDKKQLASASDREDSKDSDQESDAADAQKSEEINRSKERIREIDHIFSSFINDISQFEREQIAQWKDEINATSEENLKKNVLIKLECQTATTTESQAESDTSQASKRSISRIEVNFDSALKKLLREAKYFQKYNIDIPKKAADIHVKADTFKQQTCQLQLITNKYNLMVSTLSEAELPLLQEYIDKLDATLLPGFTDISWKSRNVDEFIADVQHQTNAVFKIYETMKSNVAKMRSLLTEFGATPLCERKNKSVSMDEFADNIDKIQKAQFVALSHISDECGTLMQQIHSRLTTVSAGDPKWKNYIKFVQTEILSELAKVVQTSIDWLIDQIAVTASNNCATEDDDEDTDTVLATPALIEVHMALFADQIKFTTSTSSKKTKVSGGHKDVWDKMQSVVMSFFKIGEKMKKFIGESDDDVHFGADLLQFEALATRVTKFEELLTANKAECEQYRQQFIEFEHLYKKDRNKEFKEFLATSEVENDEQPAAEEQSQAKIPTLERFQERIQFYKEIEEQIDAKDTPLKIGWLKIDASPLKQALETWVSKWSHTFTSFLKENLVNKINDLYDFMDNVSAGLKTEVQSGDLEGLKFVLGLIHQVRVRHNETLEMFEPLSNTVKFLRNNNVEVEDDCVKLLENASLKWESTVDKVYQAKEKVNPLQNEQVDNIKRKVWNFVDTVSNFRQEFRDNAPFTYQGMDVEDANCVQLAYQKMIFYHNAITEKEREAHQLNQLEKLFELQPSKYRALSDCRSENKCLKTLWDMISLVQHLFKSWRSTLWDDIDTEQLLSEVNKLSKRINAMDKEIRGWKAFQGLQSEVKQYQTVLPLINLLHSPTMKERHWKQVMAVTSTQFAMGKSFSLGNMIDLEIHKFVDDVEEIVEISDKENKIEMQLQKQQELWLMAESAQTFEYGVHDETKVTLIKVPEEVLVNLEEAMSVLQGIKGQGKYVAHFIAEVNKWESELGVTETVITDWLMVQSKWSSLQSIFVGSADIRQQLPDDSKRFDTVDADFRGLMQVAQDTPIVLLACNVDGRADLLEQLKRNLELCEKSLNQYLDTKKMAFPRFYFLSNVALLDLLSNGNNPQRVQTHMGDCFDNIIKLEFKSPDSKDAIGMYSKDGGEYVAFHKPFTCEGAVEHWLNGLVECMRQTLREILAKAKFSADQWELEKPRHEWLYDYCAQVALTASQIIWTEETDSQFEALEDGNETAMKDFYKVCVERLHENIKLVRKNLNRRDRTKIMTLITVDVHNRDVVQMLIDNKIESAQEFAWQAQMRYDWDPDKLICNVLVADWVGRYCFEYIGNTGRLVITPLTDRCYITLTQALRLMMGGAPAGPAGTGKTETTKDLGRAAGIPVYVFNCSEQMNVMSLGNIFKGLCQTGAWGCFDEFNRIPIEVLSVVATQVGSFLNALRAKKNSFDLMGSTIKLVDSVGVFITMNPGYAGRTELPENLKALFRSCAMVVPDMELICENMLMSEGFLNARPLAHKFITLYSISSKLLSGQKHYDWGLRATKAVLRVAGGLKRAEPEVDEARILMRALRDFNLPKIVSDHKNIFLRLLGDLFPGVDIERKVSKELNDAIIKVTQASGLQAEDMFVRKVTELAELFDVRHSVFVIGKNGTGKSQVWKMLHKAQNELGQKSVYEAFNPKAVKNDELYGWLSASTGDWYDGILSTLMRNMSRCDGGYTQSQSSKWIVLDGDIDPEWIESLNTVMDDNKVLTLVSNERIPLSASMRLLFEVSHLQNATPATVSRAGILYINECDIGWKPMIDSWIDAQNDEQLRSALRALFNKYITTDLLDHLRKNFQYVVPISDVQKLRTLTYLLQGLIHEKAEVLAADSEKLEKHFVYCLIWAFGGSLLVDETTNHKTEFSNWFKNTYQIIAYPYDQDVEYGSNTVFDYFYDEQRNDIVRWETKINAYSPPMNLSSSGSTDQTLLLSTIMVETSETVRLLHYVRQLQKHGNPALFVGTSGTGKTAVLKSFLKSLPVQDYATAVINLNSYTDATTLRDIMQQYVDKRSGRNYGPPGGKKLVYFIDDLNMPYVDTYGTQSPIALIRQHMDYMLWYDTNESDPTKKKKIIHDCHYLAAMNNKAGSFTVNQRLMAHFATFCCSTPTRDQLVTIYRSILDGHLSNFTGEDLLLKEAKNITNATIDLLETMAKSPKFKPSSTKFHYSFTTRDVSNVFQGLVTSKPDTLSHLEFVRLWYHECTRVFGDRLVDQNDVDAFNNVLREQCKKHFADFDQEKLTSEPLLFGSFIHKDKAYTPVASYDELNKSLEAFLADHNENNAELPLVLFEMAMNHVVRIARIISSPKGHAFLIGVGGSGKQSLTRLASWICGYEVFQIQVTRLYSSADLLEDIKTLYMKAGVKGQGVTFMLTDSQIVDERWLVYINDLLSSGDIPSLFGEDEKDSIYSSLRSEFKQHSIDDTNRAAMWEYFINKVSTNLHMVLCFSPVGEAFRVRCRKFPALINCTSLDWFFSWPYDALTSVAYRFLGESEELAEILSDEQRDKIAHHMAHDHVSVNAMSSKYYQVEKRYNYTTPKSFLELIDFYKKLFKKQSDGLYEQIQRLDKGIATLQKTAKDVASLKEDLIKKLEIVEEKKIAANALIEKCGKERVKVDAEKAVAMEEKAKSQVVLDRANGIKAECDEVLKKAMPALNSAKNAVDCLTKASLTELKALKTPDAKIVDVTKAVLILKEKEKKNHTWKRSQAMMSNVDKFKRELEEFNKEEIDASLLNMIQPILKQEYFNQAAMSKISVAASNLCVWVVAIVQYNGIYKDVAPKMAAAREAETEHAEAMAKLKQVEEHVAAKEALLKKVTDELQDAISEKNRVEQDAQACQDRLALAERLVGGLSDENKRWSLGVASLQQKKHTLVGDVLLSAAFVSYIGAFNSNFRKELWEKHWLTDIIAKEIPVSDNIKSLELTPKDVLTSVSDQAKWANEGLPVDSISIENAAIVTLCSRWPLLIDPQQQGIKWIRNHHPGDELKVINLNHPRWLSSMTRAVEQGHTVLIENVSENIDPTLDPILSRAIIKKGRSMRIKIAGEEKDYDPRFKLYLQTKLSNPHYKPELFAQCTLINFIVTEGGLEEQLLALVVNEEKPELEDTKRSLMRSINEYMVKLSDLENELLYKLSNAPDDILSDVSLIEGLENTKKASKEIELSVAQAKEKEIEINNARNEYRSVAQEASWIYFLLIQLNAIDHMYQYSLDAFITFFYKAMRKSKKSDDIKERVMLLRNEIRFVVFTWVSRGLFEKHKLIFSSQMTFKLMQKNALGENVKFDASYFQFLIFGQRKYGVENPINWLPDASWSGLCKLSELSGLERFVSDLVASPNRFKEWYLKQAPEQNTLPLDWRKLDDSDPFAKLCIVRCMRPDRMTVAIEHFVAKTLPNGKLYTELDAGKSFHEVLSASLDDSNKRTPIFFILSAGADPVQTVYDIALKSGLVDSGKYHRVAMGQGQDVIAMKKLEVASKEGHWVVLENIHLMPKWCKELEKTLDAYDTETDGVHDNFRLFLSAEPSTGIPIGILERSIKLTNEPPQGMKANLKRAFASFPKEEFDFRESQVKSIQFALCWFHSVMIERKKFGPKGWNAVYPFNTGDLVNSGTVLVNKLENTGNKIPWADLRYIFGEIMYGGHITDDWDRLLCMTYLKYYLKNELFDELNMIPFIEASELNANNKFIAPPALSYDEYFSYMDECLPATESPNIYGLHPNTEIAVRTQQSNDLFASIMELQPKNDSASNSGQSPAQRASAILEEILDKISDINFDMDEIFASLPMEDRGPYQYVFLQECERMNSLIQEMNRSLKELDLGLHGELTMSERMEQLQQSLYFQRVPSTWASLAFPSLRSLPSWRQNLLERAAQLQEWVDNPTQIPAVVNVAYLFNPQSFLTAVMQVAARKNNLELDKLAIVTEVTRKLPQDIDEPARDGAYITGLNLEGARWNVQQGVLDTCEPREMFSPLPVVNCKTILASKMESNGIYKCPVYQTQQRGPTYVFTAPLRTKQDADKWVLAGACVIMDYVD